LLQYVLLRPRKKEEIQKKLQEHITVTVVLQQKRTKVTENNNSQNQNIPRFKTKQSKTKRNPKHF
jgi:hypothetical protein